MAKNEAKIKFSAETSDFNKSIKKTNDELASLRAEMKLNDTQMKTTGTSVEGLKKKHDLLENQLKASQDKTEALNQKLNKAAEIYGENSTEVMKLRTQLANAQTAEERIRQAIDACNNEIAEQKRVASEAESATSKLSKEINNQQSDLDALKKKYSDLVLEQGDSSDEAKKLAREIESLSGDLKQNKNALNDAAKKANELDQSFDDAGDSAGGAGEGFTVMKGVVADLASSAIQAAIGKISEFCGWLAELPEATAELRQDLSTLNTSFDDVGHTTETATDTWKELYSVFGEDDRAVETANNIAKIADNEKELNKWIDITTGAWGKHQDSLPVEGLAEASMESAKTGKITGVLADALNWCANEGETYGVKLKKNIEFTKLSAKELSKLTPKQKAEYEAKKKQYEETEKYNKSLKEAKSAEEKFQFALDKCSTEQERAELITNTLNDLYSESADTYREAQGSQMEAKDATAENMLAQAELATAIEPVTTAFTELKTELMQGIQPAVENVSEAMTGALEWAKEHPTAMKAIAGAVTVLAVGLGGLATAAAIYTAYQWAMNSAILANPITWIVVGIIAAIAALVAIIIVVIDYWDEIVVAVKKCWETIKSTLSKWGEWINDNVIQPVVNFFKDLWETITTACSDAWEGIKDAFSSFVSWVDTDVIQPVVNFFKDLWTAIKDVWDTICDVVQLAIMFIGSLIDGAVQIITLPFRFIWENCKEAVFTAWEWIKEKISTALNAIKNVISTVWNAIKNVFTTIFNVYKNIITTAWNAYIKVITTVLNAIKSVITKVFDAIKSVVSTVWNAIKNAISKAVNAIKNTISKVWNSIKTATSKAFNSVKTVASNVWNGIKNTISNVVNTIKSKVSSVWNNIKSATSNAFNNVKSTATSVFSKVKTAITKPIESAKDKVKSMVDSIKGFFKNMKLSFPKIKMPHFKITGKFDIKKMTVPKLGIEWYAQGGIMTRPTIFGMNGDSLMAGGEAGPEAILPISKLEDYIDNAFQRNVAYAGATYNFYLDNATVNDNAKMRSVAKDFITEMVRLGGMNR